MICWLVKYQALKELISMTCHLKVKNKKKKLVGLWRREELKDNLGILIMLLLECMFVELFYKSS